MEVDMTKQELKDALYNQIKLAESNKELSKKNYARDSINFYEGMKVGLEIALDKISNIN
jgi:hypothetical protein